MIEVIILAVFGLIFGSFVNALVWRVHTGKSMNGRSKCTRCKHRLEAKDLIPVFSWLALKGKCRYCAKPISWQYPAVELATAAVFVLSYLFWPYGLDWGGGVILFITWLAAAVGLLALLVSDFRWMLLPSKILYPTAAIAAAGRLVYVIGYEPAIAAALLEWVLSIGVAAGIFWAIYMLNDKWIGYGDVRLGLITGTLLASPDKSLLMIFLASILGTLFVLPALLSGKKTLGARLPYGPFLIIATAISLLFGSEIISWYKNLLI